jgi:hypothetical protein
MTTATSTGIFMIPTTTSIFTSQNDTNETKQGLEKLSMSLGTFLLCKKSTKKIKECPIYPSFVNRHFDFFTKESSSKKSKKNYKC